MNLLRFKSHIVISLSKSFDTILKFWFKFRVERSLHILPHISTSLITHCKGKDRARSVTHSDCTGSMPRACMLNNLERSIYHVFLLSGVGFWNWDWLIVDLTPIPKTKPASMEGKDLLVSSLPNNALLVSVGQPLANLQLYLRNF